MKKFCFLFSLLALAVNAAVFESKSKDVTAELQKMLSSEKEVIIPARKAPYQISSTLRMSSNQTLILKPGAVLEAAPDKFHGRNDEFLSLENLENVKIIGYGSEIRMRKKDYQDKTRYSLSEHRHGIIIRDCKNVEVSGVTVRATGGDGLYVGTRKKVNGYCSDITVRDSVFDDNHRQGISIISVENLLVERCIFSNTSGTAPEAGIDFEPNNPTQRLVNCIVRDCLAYNNRELGYHMWLKNIMTETRPVSIRFERCVAVGGFGSAHAGVGNAGARGTVEFVDCQFVNPLINGIRLRDKGADSFKLIFRNCQISGVGIHKYVSRRGKAYNLNAPVAMFTIYKRSSNPGGVEFDNLLVSDQYNRPAIVIADPINFAPNGFSNVTGTVRVNSPTTEPVKLYGTKFNGGDQLKLER
ncbi:MAG: right-handed parallel beta-helix repeat-containing protein [Lentisphaeria bacterium]|nr:right-handed parallel beta-helix repeat-containing protein [Lentisphaeria bacterium]